MDKSQLGHQLGSETSASSPKSALRRFFTIDKANRSLVLVSRIVDDILCEYRRLIDLHETVEAAQASSNHRQARATQDQLVDAVRRIEVYVEELQYVGVDLKDWTLGIVDFPCIADGREVRLCWQAGEEQICHWHDVDWPCADRKPLDSLPAAEPVPAAGA